jgi:hypothetical protein
MGQNDPRTTEWRGKRKSGDERIESVLNGSPDGLEDAYARHDLLS